MATDDKPDVRAEDPAGRRLEGLLPETIRKALITGLGALFMTEESLRNLVTEMRLPKEAVHYLVKQADQARGQLFDVVSKEIRQFLESVNLAQELQKILSSVVLEVKTEIRLVPSDDGLVKPQVSTSVQARRTKT
jgi:polyhydroxyalkanoate synthesis regulator phasin